MLLEQRVAAGIGLNVYTQNAIECMNRVIKRSMDVAKMELDEFVEHMRDISVRQQCESEAACVKEVSGVSLHKDYAELKIPEEDFYGFMRVVSPSERTVLKQKIHKAKLIVPTTTEIIMEKEQPERYACY